MSIHFITVILNNLPHPYLHISLKIEQILCELAENIAVTLILIRVYHKEGILASCRVAAWYNVLCDFIFLIFPLIKITAY